MSIEAIIFIIAAIALFVTLFVEIIEYRRYRKAAVSVIAFGESMQVSFNEIAEHLNRINGQSNLVGAGLNLAEQDINFIKGVLQVHSEALGLHSVLKNYKLQEELVRVGSDGKDSVGEVQG